MGNSAPNEGIGNRLLRRMSVEVSPGTAIALNACQQHRTPAEHFGWYILYGQDPGSYRSTWIHNQATGACVVVTCRRQLGAAPLPFKNQTEGGCPLIEPA
jgi:hypothetical protein